MALVIISGRGSDLDYVALSKEDFVRLTEGRNQSSAPLTF